MAIIGPPTTRDHIPDLLEANLRTAYLDSYSKLPKLYPQIYNVVSSNKAVEREAVMAGYGTYSQKDEGAPPQYDSGQEAWPKVYRPRTFALGAQVTQEAIADDLHGVIRWLTKLGGGLAATANYTMDRDSMDLFNSYWTSGTAYTAGGSNYSLLSTTHFRVDGGTWTNRPANAMDLSIEALEFMLSHWMVNQVNQRGQILGTSPDRIIVGASDGPLAKRLLRSVQQPQGNDNDPNVVKDDIKSAIVSRFLTNDGRWVALAPKSETMLTYIERAKPNVQRWSESDAGNMRMVGIYREAHGATGPQGIWGSP